MDRLHPGGDVHTREAGGVEDVGVRPAVGFDAVGRGADAAQRQLRHLDGTAVRVVPAGRVRAGHVGVDGAAVCLGGRACAGDGLVGDDLALGVVVAADPGEDVGPRGDDVDGRAAADGVAADGVDVDGGARVDPPVREAGDGGRGGEAPDERQRGHGVARDLHIRRHGL
ncbi:MAG: hypothetical protein ABS81_06575 [Pseudonocardia sp. SCN 72-86]|nr:MAG: hypothetical protein ABS81_06575 [Pseudonocardia sp. SCN 72-86]